SEWRNVLAAAELAWGLQDHRAVMALSALAEFLNLRGIWSEEERLWLLAVAAARASGDRQNEWKMLDNLGVVYERQGRWEEAGEGLTLNNLGIVWQRLGRWEEAIAAHEQALKIARQVKNRAEEGQMLNNLGNVYQSQRRWEEAIAAYERSLAIKRKFEDRMGE